MGFVGGGVINDMISLFGMIETWSIIQKRFRSRLSATVEGMWGKVKGESKQISGYEERQPNEDPRNA